MSTPLTTPGGISYFELTRQGQPETARFNFARTTKSSERKYRVAWSDATRFLVEWMGPVSSFAKPLVAYGDSDDDPKFPGMECVGGDIEGFGISSRDAAADDSAAYEWAIVTLKFETPPGKYVDNRNGNDILVSEELSVASEFLTKPDNAFIWSFPPQDPVGAKATPGQLIGMKDYTVKVFRRLQPDFTAIQDTQGKVNDSAFSAFTMSETFFGNQLLFLGCQVIEVFYYEPLTGVTIIGNDMTYRFKWRSVSWNDAFRKEEPGGIGGQFEPLQTTAGNPPYERINFAPIFF